MLGRHFSNIQFQKVESELEMCLHSTPIHSRVSIAHPPGPHKGGLGTYTIPQRGRDCGNELEDGHARRWVDILFPLDAYGEKGSN